MTLHDTIIADAAGVFCNANDFAESATYHPRSGSQRSIDVIINREALAVFSQDGDTITPVFEIQVANDSTLGISSAELNLGGDMLAFAIRVGQSASSRSITKLLGHDEGMLILECR